MLGNLFIDSNRGQKIKDGWSIWVRPQGEGSKWKFKVVTFASWDVCNIVVRIKGEVIL